MVTHHGLSRCRSRPPSRSTTSCRTPIAASYEARAPAPRCRAWARLCRGTGTSRDDGAGPRGARLQRGLERVSHAGRDVGRRALSAAGELSCQQLSASVVLHRRSGGLAHRRRDRRGPHRIARLADRGGERDLRLRAPDRSGPRGVAVRRAVVRARASRVHRLCRHGRSTAPRSRDRDGGVPAPATRQGVRRGARDGTGAVRD
jgi:hypothetical protein